jgi:hypothetical protein
VRGAGVRLPVLNVSASRPGDVVRGSDKGAAAKQKNA